MAEVRDRAAAAFLTPRKPRRGRGFAPLLAALLAACAAGGPLPAPDAGTPPPTVPGAAGPLALSRWGPEAPRAVILGVHGYGDHAESTFADAATDWAARGIATYAHDQRGFGRNASRGRWPGAGALVADLRAVARAVRARHPCVPLVVLGHSMGGGVALAAAPGMPADGLVLAAPAIWGGDALNPVHRLAAWGAAVAVPERRFTGEGVVEIRPTDNMEVLRRLARDPLYLSPPSARELMGLVRVMDRAAGAAPRVTTPALLLLGAQDEIVPARAVREVFARLPGPREVRVHEAGWHLLLRDLGAARVRAEIGDWALARRRPAGCSRRAG